MSQHPREQLSAYLDGELTSAQRAELQVHLAACAQCARELEELALVGQAARELDEPAPEGYFDELPGRVRQRLRAARQAAAPASRRRLLPAWSWAAAALVLVGLLLPILWKRQAEAPPRAAVTAPQGLGDAAVQERGPRAGAAGTSASRPPEAGSAVAAPKLQGPHEAEAKSVAERQDALKKGTPAGAAPPAAPATAPPAQSEQARGEDRAAPGFAAVPPAAAPAPAPAAASAERDQVGALGYVDGRVARTAPGGAGRPVATAAEPARPQAEERAEAEAAPRKDEARPERLRSKEAVSESRKAEARRSSGEDQPAAGKQKGSLGDLAELAARKPASAKEARVLARDWQRAAEQQRDAVLADEARLRALEALAEAFRLSASAGDRAALERAVAAYSGRADAAQKARARALLPTAER